MHIKNVAITYKSWILKFNPTKSVKKSKMKCSQFFYIYKKTLLEWKIAQNIIGFFAL